MTEVSVREFSYNPSAMFARAEKGETIEITRRGTVIATLVPGRQPKRSRIEELEASGALRRSGKTLADLDTFTHITVPEGAPDPLELLLAERRQESDWERRFREEDEALEAQRRATREPRPGGEPDRRDQSRRRHPPGQCRGAGRRPRFVCQL